MQSLNTTIKETNTAQRGYPPFSADIELVSDYDTLVTDVAARIFPPVDSREDEVYAFISRETVCPTLELLSHHGFLHVAGRQESDNIDPLHEFVRQGHRISVTEDPDLHLIWVHDVVMIKPLVKALLNHKIWTTHLISKESGIPRTACRAALGFLRSYAWLIRHETDFALAQESRLIPSDVTFVQFQTFIRRFRDLPDTVVAARYWYGSLRLTRLNLLVFLTRPKTLEQRTVMWHYDKIRVQTGDYVSKFGPFLLFLFALFSLVLSAMQVVLAARPSNTWPEFIKVSWGFSLATIIFLIAVSTSGILGVVGFFSYHILITYRKPQLKPAKNTLEADSYNADPEAGKK